MLSALEAMTLETLIDRHGLNGVLLALGAVCEDKADHVRASYSDNALGDAWEAAGDACGSLACSPEIQTIAPPR